MIIDVNGVETFVAFLFTEELDKHLLGVGQAAEQAVSHILAYYGLVLQSHSRRSAEEETAQLNGAGGNRPCIAWHAMALVHLIALSITLPDHFFVDREGRRTVSFMSAANGMYMHAHVCTHTYISNTLLFRFRFYHVVRLKAGTIRTQLTYAPIHIKHTAVQV